jgi:4-diphosphocytidyl-2-C-methyl-D-erythritol kinase
MSVGKKPRGRAPSRGAPRLCVRAFAKVNLGLEVLGPRQDGYHELRTVFQTVDLADRICLERRPSGITLSCSHPDVPTDERNLAWRAARDLLAWAGVRGGVAITLDKRIPVAGGLGGGSSDAAAVLRALDALYALGLGRTGLDALARRLGADVPYFLLGGTALGLARGDEVFALERQIDAHVVIVTPSRGVSTAAVFRRVDARLTPRENSSTIYRFVSSDLDGSGYRILNNDLEQAALEEAPELAQVVRRARAILARSGALMTSLSGSGSSYFGLFDQAAKARRAAEALERADLVAHCCRTLTLRRWRAAWARALGTGARRPRRAQ